MSFLIDPAALSISPDGEVRIESEKLSKKIMEALQPDALLANTGCNNTGNCTNSENEGHCVNSGTC
ncbi:hypothetical protein [Fulvimonas soli]|jgi:hypothetical protein|uniref:hypothetical protein n=1 Tax=Fulvimonas soli TaxID=155197 RepID=UPI00112485DD|nr:hypothetical protein [Fulvimonas soli]